MEQKFEREPTPEELAMLLDIEVDEIHLTLGSAGTHISLDQPFKQEDLFSENLLDVLENPNAESAAMYIDQDTVKQEAILALSLLKEREREIMKLFFGI